jgi:hypothetical protein
MWNLSPEIERTLFLNEYFLKGKKFNNNNKN